MKKTDIAKALPALLFAGALAALSVCNILVPQKDFSEIENRRLALFPSFSAEKIRTGKWMGEFESYAADQFLFRNGFMRVKTAADLALQKKDNGTVYFGKDGCLFVMDDISQKQENTNLRLVCDFIERTAAEKPQIRFSVLLAPTARSVLADKLPENAPVPDEKAAILRAAEAVASATPQVVFSDPSAVLGAAAADADDEVRLYYRTDHHWTTDGAYLAYRNWAEDYGLVALAPSAFRRETVTEEFLGTSQSKAPGASLTPDSIVRWTAEGPSGNSCRLTAWKNVLAPGETETRDSLYDDSFLSGKDKYGYFLGGNDPQLRVETPVKNGRRLLLVKDSYANCMVPFLAQHFEEIYITDLRYSHGVLILPPDETGAAPEITDVMFLYNIDSFANDRNMAYLTQLQL